MKQSEGARLVGMLFAYFPGKEPTPETAALWALELLPFEIEDGMAAAKELGTMGKFVPSLAEFVDGTREMRNLRLATDRPALPYSAGTLRIAKNPADDTGAPSTYAPDGACTIAEFLERNPEYQDRVKKLGWWKQTLANLEEK